MLLYHCKLTFHDHLFYETRTLGRLYETGRLLHNIALCYALGFASTPYHQATYAPNYAEELAELNERGIYVTPARGDQIDYVVHTFKLGEERTSVMMERSNTNIPTYGRAKEISAGSRFSFGVLSESPLTFPRWIRMGIWLSKAQLKVSPPVTLRLAEASEALVSLYPMNPNDLPPSCELRLFDLVSMRPSSLVENASLSAEAWWVGERDNQRIKLPFGMRHHIN